MGGGCWPCKLPGCERVKGSSMVTVIFDNSHPSSSSSSSSSDERVPLQCIYYLTHLGRMGFLPCEFILRLLVYSNNLMLLSL